MKKKLCNIGTIGHVDHGKTTLSSAISYILSLNLKNFKKNFHINQIDKTPEEKQRGITIKNTQIDYNTRNRYYTHVDCPGHEHYVKNMITGTSIMDGTILVISAVDGPEKQTREHLLLAQEIGIFFLLVFLNKIDFSYVDEELITVIEIEILDLLETYNYDISLIPIVLGSAKQTIESKKYLNNIWVTSIQSLMEVIDFYVPQPKRLVELPFLMPIDSVYSILGRGTVVAGKVEKGSIKIGNEIEILGYGKTIKTSCTGLEMFKSSLDKAEAGVSLGLLVRGVKKTDVKRGFVVTEIDQYHQYTEFTAKVSLVTNKKGGRKKPFSSGYTPQFFFRTADIPGVITLLNDVTFMSPGEVQTVSVKLVKPLCIEKNLTFTLREGRLTIGAGKVIKLL